MTLIEAINSIQLLSGCILLILASYGFKYRHKEIARGLIAFLVLAALWCICASIQFHPKEPEIKILINRLKMLAIIPLPYVILLMALSYLDVGSRSKQILKHLWIVPLIFCGVMLSPWHQTIITGYQINEANGLLIYSSGSLFSLYAWISRGIVFLGFYILWSSIKKEHVFHKTTVALIIFAILIPMFVDYLIVNILPELRPYQLVPVAFVATGVILIYAIVFHSGLDFMPFAKSAIIEDLSVPCMMWTQGGVLADCNLAAQRLFKIDSSLKLQDEKLKKKLFKNDSEIKVEDRVYKVLHKELTDENIEGSGSYTLLTDITESKKSEEDLKRVNRLKTDVLAVMSHDMGGLLGLLSLNAEVLSANFDKLNDDYKKNLALKICEQAREVSRFSNDLMEWSKDQFSQESFEKNIIDIESICWSVINEIKSLAEIKKQKISFEIKESIEIKSNNKLLEIIIRNLILNAIKHGNSGSLISVEVQGKLISVKNTGEFLDYEKLNLFFLNQEKNTYSGLGLKICKEFCEILDCWIEYQVNNGGTIASIRGL